LETQSNIIKPYEVQGNYQAGVNKQAANSRPGHQLQHQAFVPNNPNMADGLQYQMSSTQDRKRWI